MDIYELVREFRKKQHLSQSEFSKKYNVPLSTLRKWEQKESKPSKYFIELINRELNNRDLITISDDKDAYTFDANNMIVYNNMGIGIKVPYDISKVNRNNALIILNELFEDYYKIIDKYNAQCLFDKKGNSKWRKLK